MVTPDAPAPLASSHTAAEPVGEALRAFRLTGSLELGIAIDNALAALTAQAAALVAAEKERDEARGDLSKVAGAIGSVRFMDPPDGGDVTLAEQVARMRDGLEAAESEVATLKARVAELEAGLEPFAEAAVLIPPEEQDFKIIAHVPAGPHARAFKAMSDKLTAGNFRRARRLTPEEKSRGAIHQVGER